jgi:branched-chain amino acid transport system ATP-binding protein
MSDPFVAGASAQTIAARSDKQELLSVVDLTAGYRGRAVIYDVALEVARGEIVAILGSNGAGKTTTLKSIVGLVHPLSANIRYKDATWRTDRPWSAASVGMAFIPAERFTFAALSVEENLALGAYTVSDSRQIASRRELVLELFPILGRRLGQLAGTMSGGEQRMLSLAVALMPAPELLLLDEPSLGLAPAIVQQILGTLRTLVGDGTMSVLMVEQNVGQVLKIANRVYVMRSGRMILHETVDEMRKREQLWDLF